VLFEHNLPAKPEGGTSAAGAAKLTWIVEHLQADPTLQVRLVGHASSEGTADQNLQLSARRARSVQAALAAKGLGARIMDFVGGEDPVGCKRLEFGMWACGAGQAAAGEARPEDRKVAVTVLRTRHPKRGS
jgi:outer membrane protein OmpA-like peptidoglycan-associated protein